jgi:hypothetical protein
MSNAKFQMSNAKSFRSLETTICYRRSYCTLPPATAYCHCHLPSAYWLAAVLREPVGSNVISIRRLRVRPLTVVFEATGFEAPMPLA